MKPLKLGNCPVVCTDCVTRAAEDLPELYSTESTESTKTREPKAGTISVACWSVLLPLEMRAKLRVCVAWQALPYVPIS